MGCYPGTGRVVSICARKRFGFGKICGGDIVEILKAKTTKSGELLRGPGLIAGYQCKKCKKKYDRPPLNPILIEAHGF